MNLYQHHSDRELVTVLEQSEKLTYEAQLQLLKELAHRNADIDQTALEQQIAATELAIADMAYLKDLGFTYSEDASTGRMELRRALVAKVMDVVSIVIGTVLFALGLVYFWMLLSMFFGDNQFSLGKLIGHGIMVLAGLIGFKMLSGIHRFLDYRNFSVVKTGTTIALNSSANDKELHFTSEDVHTHLEDDLLLLKVKEVEILRASAKNLVQKMTVEELERKMKTN